ncbi:MAG TPA: M23 family metallopeptidase [Lysobacter sp.]
MNAPARSDATAYALDISGTAGSPVHATAAGKVLYSGEGTPGYEQLIVIEHAGGYVSSYSHNRKRLVAEGQSVAAGAVIAEMGHAGAARDMVHFELRRAGQLVDPRTVLPPR